MNSYMSGALVRETGTFTDIDGAPADPDTVVLKYRAGAGSIITLAYADAQLIKVSTGVYYADLDTSGFAGPDSQVWRLQWTGTGGCQAIGPDAFEVTPPLF